MLKLIIKFYRDPSDPPGGIFPSGTPDPGSPGSTGGNPFSDAIVNTLVGIGQNLFNVGSQNHMNQQSYAWQEHMYDRQRADALSDWDRNARYNSPLEQMYRFKQAGLNPNLIYGNGANAANATPVRSSSVGSPSVRAPQVDIGPAISSMYDMAMKKATISNMEKQGNVLDQEAMLKAMSTKNVAADTALKSFTTKKGEGLYPFDLSAADANIKKTWADISKTFADTEKSYAEKDVMLARNEREIAINAVSIQKALEEILTLRLHRKLTEAEIVKVGQEVANAKQQNDINDYDFKKYKDVGIQKHDALPFRILGELADRIARLFK